MSLFPTLATGASAVVGAVVTFYSQGLKLNKDAVKPLGVAAGAVAVGQLVSNFFGMIVKNQGSVLRYTVHTITAATLTYVAKSYLNLSRNEAFVTGALTTATFLLFNQDGGNGGDGERAKKL
jgi:uncharacterized membrane protein